MASLHTGIGVVGADRNIKHISYILPKNAKYDFNRFRAVFLYPKTKGGKSMIRKLKKVLMNFIILHFPADIWAEQMWKIISKVEKTENGIPYHLVWGVDTKKWAAMNYSFEVEGLKPCSCGYCGRFPQGIGTEEAFNLWGFLGGKFICPECHVKITGREMP